MADLLGVEIARPGSWKLSTGQFEATPKHLVDAAAYGQRPEARPAPVKLGHTDPRFDGEPALGWLTNLRVEGKDDDSVLIGDIVGMPDWLSDVIADAYPDRSLEGWSDLKTSDGRTYSLVIDGLALLGVTPPGMSTLRSLRDLPQALGVAASARIAATVQIAAAVSDTPWSQFTAADYTPEQWARACLIDTGEGETDSKARYKLPVREPGGALNRNGCHAAASVLGGGRGGVNASPDQIASAKRKLASLYRTQLGEDPPDALTASAPADPQTPVAPAPGQPSGEEPAVAFSDEQITNLRKLAGVPEDADEATILAALDQAIGEASPTPAPQPQAASAPPPSAEPPTNPQPTATGTPAPAPQPAAQPTPGTMVIDASAWSEREERIKGLEAADTRRRRDERDHIIKAAVGDGKFPVSRTDHWGRLWDADPEGTRQVIAGLAKNVVPVEMAGNPGDPDYDGIDDEFAHLFPPQPAKGA